MQKKKEKIERMRGAFSEETRPDDSQFWDAK
jgi:hypothetical protein